MAASGPAADVCEGRLPNIWIYSRMSDPSADPPEFCTLDYRGGGFSIFSAVHFIGATPWF